MAEYTHLHLHTQYSVLDGASNINELMERATEYGMKSMAISDHGNMFGVKVFHKAAKKAGIKPILGSEVYVARNSMHSKKNKEDRSGNHMVILAKNKVGYHNLMKLVSYGWTDGFYYKPRIDNELLFKHSEGLIVLTACLGGAVPQAILKGNPEKAEEIALKYKAVFGDDFYLELQRHRTGDAKADERIYDYQVKANAEIIEIAKRTGIKLVATNDVHFVKKEDAEIHDILICLSTSKDLDDPNRMRYTGQEFLKSPEEMAEIFADVPEAIAHTQEITNKIEEYELDRKAIMPPFPLPENFSNEEEYLRHLTFEGAKMRWGEINEEQEERLNFELDTIIRMGFPGYFLITWDFIKAGRDMGVLVGPGRGSAAGSAVAYCLRITEIDPIAYGLLFERFLNPDRISMPDIDIDFDDEGREKVIEYVVEKYGQKRVANIITFGTMATKSSIKDVARVLKLDLPEANRIAKLVLDKPGTNFTKAFKASPELVAEKNSSNPLIAKTMDFAVRLEGTIRNTGTHACGIIIGRDNLEEHIPLSTSKDSKLFVTQYDGKHVEDVGMLKMDFLGLKTLSIIKECVANIKLSQGIEVDIDNVPLDDKKTFELYANGETTAIFQFESDGMKKHLRALKPNKFEDLIAMNALYRPGPMEYIPSFIARKHGREKIHYDLPEMKEYLNNTYGITVYQEQVMQLSQKIAGFTKGQADSLRKAMGKKLIDMMNDLKGKFMEGAMAKGHPEKILEKIWKDWEAFAQYAFNKSHSTCYAYVAYQTAYLKAHYPAEFMAAVLSNNLSNITKISTFMDESRRMGFEIKGPDVNESYSKFTVNKKGELRFGLTAIKGVGANAVEAIIEGRKENKYTDFYDFVERLNLSTVSKKTIEGLAIAGALDDISGISRSQFFATAAGADGSFIDTCVKYGNKLKAGEDSNMASMFGGDDAVEIKKPDIPQVEEWSRIDRLNKEKELIGIFLSEHPLDDFKLEIDTYCKSLSILKDMDNLKGVDLRFGGIITSVNHATTKNGKPFGSFVVEDYKHSHKIVMFGKDYLNFKNYMTVGYAILLKGRVEHRFGQPNAELELKIRSIEMLAEAKDKMLHSLSVKIPVDKISPKFIDDFYSVVEQHKGNTELKFIVYTQEQEMGLTWVQMFSRTQRVSISNGLIDFLESAPEVEYKIA